jgi:sulfite reductase (NADPH) flavoprotein alpha-component
MSLTTEVSRWLAAGGVGLSYAAFCAFVFARARQRAVRRHLRIPGAAAGKTLLVAYASQSGFAEELAGCAAGALAAGGQAVTCLPMGELDAEILARTEQALFVVSTAGEGDAPDNALAFVENLMTVSPELSHLHYGLLALGDRSYARYCGFGRTLQGWLERQGAVAMFPAIDVDRGDAVALQDWRRRVAHLAGTADLPDWQGPDFARWRIAERRCLNPGSAGAPAFHLELLPLDPGQMPLWEAGDLVQVLPPGDAQRPREYSIASTPADGRIHLLVRQFRDPSGQPGLASGWLTKGAGLDSDIALRWRAHRNFRLDDNSQRPLILIGSGTGIAGLRAHLKARAQRGDGRNWLIFGERNADPDFFYRNEIEAWQADDLLVRVDLAFSREQSGARYVQDVLRKAAMTLREWVDGGAAIYVCGSAAGMGAGVDSALIEVLGQAKRDELLKTGRYRRDVY